MKNKKHMDETQKVGVELVHLARLGLAGRRQDVILYVRRLIKQIQAQSPEIAKQLGDLLTESPTSQNPIRGSQFAAVPVDHDSRLQLARVEYPVVMPVEPIWSKDIKHSLEQVVEERSNEKELLAAGLHPTKSLLFTGLPGVGKSLTASWLAYKLERPLVVLDLSAVMSSFLGRTGSNLRHVLDYAKSVPCVLLLDEFDAVAKRRDDKTEIGELKRLVTVLLQEIDDFPPTGLLVAATNHPDLLDPAVWRRFEMILEFPLPSLAQVKLAIKNFLGVAGDENESDLIEVLSLILKGYSFSDIQRFMQLAKRESVIRKVSILETLETLLPKYSRQLSRADKEKLVINLGKLFDSQRYINKLTTISRDTIRKHLSEGVSPDG